MNTATVLIFPGLGDCVPCRLAQAKQRAAAIRIVRRVYAERIVESGVKRAWDRREAEAGDE